MCPIAVNSSHLLHLVYFPQQNPSQRVNYPFLPPPPLQRPPLSLPPLPPHYDSISKYPPPPPLASIQPNALRGVGGVGGNPPKVQNSTACHVQSGVMVSADLMPKHGVVQTDGYRQRKPANHPVGYERAGQIQGPPQHKQEMGVVPIMSTAATSMPLQFPSAPIMGAEAPCRAVGIDPNGGRRPRSRKRMLSQSGQLTQGVELASTAGWYQLITFLM